MNNKAHELALFKLWILSWNEGPYVIEAVTINIRKPGIHWVKISDCKIEVLEGRRVDAQIGRRMWVDSLPRRM